MERPVARMAGYYRAMAPHYWMVNRATFPRYWMDETSGVLSATVKRYLDGRTLEPSEIRWMRLYCKQWVNSPMWDQNPNGTEGLAELRAAVETITDTRTLTAWIDRATEAGMDPL